MSETPRHPGIRAVGQDRLALAPREELAAVGATAGQRPEFRRGGRVGPSEPPPRLPAVSEDDAATWFG
jgi:hypothetical protein